MKRKAAFAALLVICVCLIAGGTSAFFTDEETAVNVITTGTVEVKLNEWTIKDGQRVPFENVKNAAPGEAFSKIAEAENTGSSPAWIMAVVEVTESAPVVLDYNDSDWTCKDGAFYYNKPLEAGETTAALFTTVTLDPAMGNSWQSSEIEVKVTVYAVQSANNGATVFDAAGWPDR